MAQTADQSKAERDTALMFAVVAGLTLLLALMAARPAR